MFKRKRKGVLLALLCSAMVLFAETEYTSGVFILNEDWYGHNNSTINHLSNSGEFSYRVLQAANGDSHLSLGCTSQYGTIYGDRFYIVSKQAQDPGDNNVWKGGRVVVADAKTLKVLYSLDTIFTISGKSAADGRGFVGVDETKGYVGTSNGIFVLDFAKQRITGRIAGTENPLISGGETNTDGTGPLYQNQIGMMIRTHDYVFAIQQDKGVLVIDPVKDTIVTTLCGCFSTMVQSKDGRIWAARNTNAEWQTYPYGAMGGESWQGSELLCINPATLEQTAYDLTALSGNENMMVEQTWYAWTAGSLCASLKENALYYSYSDNIWDWYNGRVYIYKFNLDEMSVSLLYTTTDDLKDYYIYNSGMVRVSPHTGMVYTGCFKSTVSTNDWLFARISPAGELTGTFTPIKNFWYPALFIFPDMYDPLVSDFEAQMLAVGQTVDIPLGGMATDKDHLSAAITKRVLSVSGEKVLSATIARDTLRLRALAGSAAPVEVVVRFNSNGKTVDKTLRATISSVTTTSQTNSSSVVVRGQGDAVVVSGVVELTDVVIYNMLGHVAWSGTISNDVRVVLPRGGYVVRVDSETYRVVVE